MAIHVSLPTRGDSRSFLIFSFRSFCFRPLPFRTIAHTLVRTVSPALCRFARSDTPWPQGSRTYSAQKNFTCPGHTDRPILLHFPLISLRDSRQEHSGPGSWKNTSELISLRDSRRWPIWSVWLLCMVSPIDFASRFPPVAPKV